MPSLFISPAKLTVALLFTRLSAYDLSTNTASFESIFPSLFISPTEMFLVVVDVFVGLVVFPSVFELK